MIPIAILVSGGGTNLQALINASDQGALPSGKIALVVSSNPAAYALERAKQRGIPSCVISRREYSLPATYNRALLDVLGTYDIRLIILAGYLAILDSPVLQAFPRRIINVHPSLLPAFGGRGFYGLKVHKSVLAQGVKITGATVHYVDQEIDGGEIILQKAVEVREGDSPEVLQKRVMEEAEWRILPAAAELVCRKIEAEDRRRGTE
jgi:phosphoribosylglycinamide formyltransferase-1